MLGHQYRLRIVNTQNQAITCALKARLWKFNSSGALVYSAEQTLIASGSVAATTGTAVSGNIDNSADLYLGAELALSCAAAGSANGAGAVSVFLERSTDGGTTWPTAIAGACNGEFVGGYTVTTADATSARGISLSLG